MEMQSLHNAWPPWRSARVLHNQVHSLDPEHHGVLTVTLTASLHLRGGVKWILIYNINIHIKGVQCLY